MTINRCAFGPLIVVAALMTCSSPATQMTDERENESDKQEAAKENPSDRSTAKKKPRRARGSDAEQGRATSRSSGTGPESGGQPRGSEAGGR